MNALGPIATRPSVTVPPEVLDRYGRISRWNSPYPAHDDGCAIDLYPVDNVGISPVSGRVRETMTVRCPNRPYAAAEDHLIVIELDDEWCRRAHTEEGTIARILHVTPEVDPGDAIACGDPLGPMTRSGFFGQWVTNHIHLGFRPPGVNAKRASGSIPVDLAIEVRPLHWNGTGTVIERGPTHVVLDEPTHPDPGGSFAAIGSDGGAPLDGGMVHYPGGGTFSDAAGPVSFLGTRIGTTRGRAIEWAPVDVIANDATVHGLSLVATRVGDCGTKIVCPNHEFEMGESVTVEITERRSMNDTSPT